MKIRKQFFILITCCLPSWIAAQNNGNMTRTEYIDTYSELAMREMERTGIPASITLAQGILESGDGNSKLAKKGNNHFGIKCHDWEGKTMRHDDDANNECFRKYNSAEKSYEDHSDFLTNTKRYSFLFEYERDDYKAWAKGLKEAGYATSSSYSKRLIAIIEENKLYQLDQEVIAREKGEGKKQEQLAYKEEKKKTIRITDIDDQPSVHQSKAGGRVVDYNNRVKYIIAREGDTFTSLSAELDLLGWQLPKYNDLSANTRLDQGQKVYIQPKRNKAEAGKRVHKVRAGETLLSISQIYAVKADKLAANNLLSTDQKLQPGQELLLRKRKVSGMMSGEIAGYQSKLNNEEQDFQVDFNLGD